MNEVMGTMLDVLRWGAAALVLLGALLLLAWLAEKWCFGRAIAAGGNEVSYWFWNEWDHRFMKAEDGLLFVFFFAVAIFALAAAVFVGLTTWWPPVWE